MGAVVAGALFTAGTTAYAVTAFVVNLAVSYVIGRALAPDAPSLSSESRDLKRTIRAPASPRRVIYGETLVGGNLVFVESTGTTNQYLHMVICYAGHPVHSIGDIYINDTLSTDSRFGTASPPITVIDYSNPSFIFNTCILDNGYINEEYYLAIDGITYHASSVAALAALLPTSQYTPTTSGDVLTLTGTSAGSIFEVNSANVFAECSVLASETAYSLPVPITVQKSSALLLIKKHNGSIDQEADADLVANIDAWTTAHRLQGIAYLYIRLKYDDSVWLTGIPEVRAVIRGKEIYNPSTEVFEWTDNWALCIRDYLTSSYGLACDATEIESTLMAAAIATSDEEVEHPGPGRYKQEWGWNAITDLAGWTNTNCTLTTDTTDPDHDNILITPTTTDPYISKTSLSLEGYVYYKVRALIKRTSGSGWDGTCYYSTSGHSWSFSYRKTISVPSGIDSGWVVAEWDMSSLSAGGTDWTDNTVTGIRLDLSNDASTTYRVAFVSVSKPYKRYTCNGAFALDQKPSDIMDKLLTAGAGSLVFSQGKYRLYAGEYHTPTVTLDESDLRGPIKVRPRQSRKDLFNEVKGLYIEPHQFWESVEFPIVQNSTYVTQDNSETITREIELPFTQDPYTAQRIAKIHLEKSRQGITIEYPCKLTALQLSAMDTVMVTNTAFGWSSKVFRIISWSLSSDGGVDLILQEESSAVYDWNNGNATFADPAPDTTLPSPWTLTAPDTLALDSSAPQHISNVDGSTSVRIYVTWNKTDDRQKGFDVEYKISSQSNWVRNSTFIPDEFDYIVVPIDGTDYDVRVRGVSAIGVNSDWVTESNHTVPTGNVAQDTVNVGGTPAADVLNDLAQALSDASNAQATADGKIQSFYQTTAPATGMSEGDLWIDTNDGNKLYRYNGSSWVDIQDDSITTAQSTASTAITDAATAQATADGKVTTFYTGSTPTAEGVGDLWVDTTNDLVYRWSGSSWVLLNFDFSSVTGSTKPDDNADVTADNTAGSGVNILNANYSIFEGAQLPTMATITRATAAISSTAYFGTKSLSITATGADGYIYLGSSATDYNLKLSPGKKWIFSAYVRSNNTSSSIEAYLALGSATHRGTGVLTTSGTANTWTRVSGVINCTADTTDTTAVLRIDVNDSGHTVLWDGLMLEEEIGTLTTPSSYVEPVGDIAGETAKGIIIPAGYLSGGTDTVLIDYANKRLTVGDETYQGVGFQAEYNSGSPRAYLGNGETKYIEFDGTDVLLGEDTDILGVPSISNNSAIFVSSFFESLDGYDITELSSATVNYVDPVTGNNLFVALSTGTSSLSSATMKLQRSYVEQSMSKKRRFAITFEKLETADKTVYIGVGDVVTAASMIGFILDMNVSSGAFITAFVKNGGSTTRYYYNSSVPEGSTTSTSFGNASTAKNILYFEYTPANDTTKFYLNGSLVGSVARDLITSAGDLDNLLYVALVNDTGLASATTSLALYNFKFWQEG